MYPSQSTQTSRTQRRAIPLRRRFFLLSRPTYAVAAAALLGWAATLGPAGAQASDGSGDTQPVQPCVAQPPDQPTDQAKGTDAAGGNGTAQNDPRPSLGECGGVLAPPKTGDQEMRLQPPDTGTTPVIPPGALPPQQPK